jgi:uncharacterized protein (DUF58 family)
MKAHTISPEITQKIRQIEIQTRRLLTGSLVGDNSSAQKGSGFEFDQIREYQLGDDVRFIDWKSTARMNKLLVRQYIEERNRTIILAVDVSPSTLFSSSNHLKYDVISQIASMLALVADYGKDAVSLVLFSDHVELAIPPARGRMHALRIVEALLTHKQQTQQKTSISCALDYVTKLHRKDAIVFLISDFVDAHDFERSLRMAAAQNELVAVRCLDANETTFPPVGFIEIHDTETGDVCTINTRNNAAFAHALSERLQMQKNLFKRYGVDTLDVMTHAPFISDTIKFFRRRMRY